MKTRIWSVHWLFLKSSSWTLCEHIAILKTSEYEQAREGVKWKTVTFGHFICCIGSHIHGHFVNVLHCQRSKFKHAGKYITRKQFGSRSGPICPAQTVCANVIIATDCEG